MPRWEEFADLVDKQDTSEMTDRGELTEVDLKVSISAAKYISCDNIKRLPLWLIERKYNGTGWVDEAYGYVVRAISSSAARKLAAECRGGDEPEDVWLDPDKSTCTRITASGKPKILLAAIRGA